MNNSMRDDFKRDGLFTQIMKRITDLEAFEREFRLKQFGSGGGGNPLWFPFGAYTTNSPIAVTPAFPYLGTVDRSITFVNWTQHVYVATTNSAVNYWIIELICAPGSVFGTVIATINTSALANDVHSQLSTNTFAVPSVDTTDIGVWVQVRKNNAPGSLFIGGPSLEITA